ncbi:MAG: hypothetical protein FWC91_05055 [Defluviitaleaceae bacterium]|nr:hypothetical protein [Defluviitaleaceae bacterium]
MMIQKWQRATLDDYRDFEIDETGIILSETPPTLESIHLLNFTLLLK